MKRNLEELNMGLVEANFVCIHKSEKAIWLGRGFEEQRDFPIFLGELNDDETVMLGIPRTISDFGASNFEGAKVLKISTSLGTYGMGGPGFFGLLCGTKQGHFWLTFTVWGSGQYVMMDKRVIECHSAYSEQYSPWRNKGDDELNFIFAESVITNINLSAEECKINLTFIDGTNHEMIMYKYNKNLPPMGNGKPRKPAFEEGTLLDYLLVTYEYTVLQV
jgi:hypothetical protein